jgi:CheY-like chemotaxis protein
MLTSGSQRGDIERCRALGIAEHLIKPVLQQELLDSIKRAMGKEIALKSIPEGTAIPETCTSLRILLVEDNVVNQKLAVRLLEKAGHSIRVADNGRLAVDATAQERFDVVLMDVQMPEMGGFEATAIIREREKATAFHTPIVAMTAHAMIDDREKCLGAGMDDYISKPISILKLVAILKKFTEPVDGLAQDRQIAVLPVDQSGFLSRIGGDIDRIKEAAILFADESPALLARMRCAIAALDFRALERAAHSYKAAISAFSSAPAMTLASDLEHMGSRRDLSGATRILSLLEDHAKGTSSMLTAICEENICAS